MTNRDPYSLLGISYTATDAEIRTAYMRMARVVHPDRFDPKLQPREWQDANELFKAANHAYSILRDPERRAALQNQRFGHRPPAVQTAEPKAHTQKTSDGPGDFPDLRPGSGRLQELPSKVRQRLLDRQAERMQNQTWVSTEDLTGRYGLAAVTFIVWLFVLYTMADSHRWAETTISLTLAGSLGFGLLFSSQLLRIARWHSSILKPRLYITPLYVIETTFDVVRWWPILKIKDLKVTHNYRNSVHSLTQLRFEFGDSDFSVKAGPKDRVVRLLSGLAGYRKAIHDATAHSNWNYFDANDDFRPVGQGSYAREASHSFPSYVRYAYVIGFTVAFLAWTFAFSYNQSQGIVEAMTSKQVLQPGGLQPRPARMTDAEFSKHYWDLVGKQLKGALDTSPIPIEQKRNIWSAYEDKLNSLEFNKVLDESGIDPLRRQMIIDLLYEKGPVDLYDTRGLHSGSNEDQRKRPASAGLAFDQSIPENGFVRRFHDQAAVAPLEIRTGDSGEHCFVKLVNSATGQTVLTVFIRSGQSVKIDVPLEVMKMRWAWGRHWYGESQLFGPDTNYAEAEQLFDFQQIGSPVSGNTVELFLQHNSNPGQTRIQPGQW